MSHPPSLTRPTVDLVSSDLDALASHMRHCAMAQGRWFSMRSNFHDIRALAAGRIVTMACLALVVGAGFLAVA